ncbi:transmembrane protein 121B [Parasteatoda tepidariorum]|uniref:transmembrane protein 121B n=1 Tax=Parasteatoda tepidariorum TaxID=114398 RepID=UPI00077F98E5|nr:uncharacterized protein LOC107449644 [Parasteatoda tepidariorum]
MIQTEPSSKCSYRLVLHVADCLGLLLIIVLQGSILDYYLILHNGGNAAWYFWFLADFLILIAFMAAAVISYRFYQKKERQKKAEAAGKKNIPPPKKSNLGYLPLVYIVWFIYSSLLTSKVVLLFKLDVAQSLDVDSAFGTQLLKIIIASSAVVFLLLVETHNNAEPHSDGQAYIHFLITSTVFEIFDSVTFLGILFPTQSKIVLTYPLENAILILSCINFILPTMTLYKLSLSEFGNQPRSLGLKLLHKFLHLGLVNIPYFAIRVYLWNLYDHDVTLFLVKNILAVLVTVRTIYPDLTLWWHSLKKFEVKRRTIFGGAMELGTIYEITDHNGDECKIPLEEKKEQHSTEL